MESASDRSPDPNRTNHNARHPLPAHLRLHPIASPGSPPACRVSPHAGSGRAPGCRSNHQDLLGRQDVRSTMIYTHVLNRGGRGVRSPVDTL